MKATSNFKVVNKEKIFNHPVIAWYCPSIPYSFGPNGYSGLPGLILELQVRNVVYGATQIELNTTETFEIDTKKMKILNEQEYKEALDKMNDF
jgi:GLPGLI family protein